MIKVQICQGTTCYVMGAANLVEWITALPDAIKCHLDISGCHCLKLCTDGAFDGAPYVMVNGEVISGATPERIIDALSSLLPSDIRELLKNRGV